MKLKNLFWGLLFVIYLVFLAFGMHTIQSLLDEKKKSETQIIKQARQIRELELQHADWILPVEYEVDSIQEKDGHKKIFYHKGKRADSLSVKSKNPNERR